jgi:hypothetical protein
MDKDFKQLSHLQLAALYSTTRPGRRVVIDELVNTLIEMQGDAVEQAVTIKEKQGFPEANELINYIKSK